MSDEEISTTPVPSPKGKLSSTQLESLAPSPPLSSPRSWVKPLTAVGAIGTAIFITLPKMFHYLDQALGMCKEPSNCGFMTFLPAILCFCLSLTAFLPTWIKDSGSLVGAVRDLIGKITGK